MRLTNWSSPCCRPLSLEAPTTDSALIKVLFRFFYFPRMPLAVQKEASIDIWKCLDDPFAAVLPDKNCFQSHLKKMVFAGVSYDKQSVSQRTLMSLVASHPKGVRRTTTIHSYFCANTPRRGVNSSRNCKEVPGIKGTWYFWLRSHFWLLWCDVRLVPSVQSQQRNFLILIR